MRRDTILRLGLTLGWALALATFFRYWELTLQLGGLLPWTVGFTVLYLATTAGLQGAALRARTHPAWKTAAAWTTLVAIAWVGHRLAPVVVLFGVPLPTISMVGALDVGLPLWILVRTVMVVWPGRERWLVLGAVPAYLLLLMSTFVIRTPGRSYAGPLPPLTAGERALQRGLERHVRMLSDSLGERHEGAYRSLLLATQYLAGTLAQAGYPVDTFAFQVRIGISIAPVKIRPG